MQKIQKVNCFISDIVDILTKYDLSRYLISFIQTETFPGLRKWKRLLNSTLQNFKSESGICAYIVMTILNVYDFCTLTLWECCADFQSLANAYSVSKLWIQRCKRNNTFVSHVWNVFTDSMTHLLFECSCRMRESLFTDILKLTLVTTSC